MMPRWFWLAALVAMLVVPGCERRTPAPPVLDSVQVEEGGANTVMARGAVLAGASVGDTSLYKITYSLSAPPRPIDTVTVKVSRDSSAGVSALSFGTKFRFLQRDTASFKVPKVYGKVANYRTCVGVRSTVVVSPNKCSTWRTNIPAPVTPPPVVDSVRVDSSLAQVRLLLIPPALGTLQQDWRSPFSQQNPGLSTAQKWGCVIVIALDGKARMLKAQQTVTACRGVYDALPASQKLAGYPVAYTRSP